MRHFLEALAPLLFEHNKFYFSRVSANVMIFKNNI